MASVDRRFGQTLSPAPSSAARFGARPSGAAAITVATPDEKLPRDRVRDLCALSLLATCVFLVAALATFHPADPPASRVFPPHARAENACGQIGATASAALYEAFGLGAWFVVAFLAVLDIMLLRRRPLPDLPLRAIGAVVAIAGGCTLLAMFLPDAIARPIWGPGGYAGATGKMFAQRYFATTGAAIVVTAMTGAGLFLAADVAVVRLTAWLAATLTALAGGLLVVGTRLGSLVRLPRGRVRVMRDSADVSDGGDLPYGFGGDAADGDDDDSEPMIRVKRREIPVLDDEGVDDESDAETSLAEEADGDLEESVDEEPPVPIRSLTKRRPKPQVLDIAPDPAADYELPSLDLLLPTEYLEMEQQEQEVRERARVLEKTFAEFGFKVKVVEIETGPVISQYEIELEAGLRLAKITNLGDDLAIALRVPSVRIVAPIPGKNSVGIEVPNTTRQMVRLREVIEETQAKSRSMKIPIYLGKDVAGNPMVVDMAALPHLLIAGRTGTGKSVCLNSIMVRMLMIDPKMVELTPYKSLPHLMHPVVTDMKKAEAILAWAVEKMEERYALLAKVGVRHLTQYNALGREKLLERIKPETEEEAAAIPTTMPFIVMIADEIADMMMTAGKEIEQHIIRLAQKSRAVGIHLILATQKPTVDVITGLIKSNLPARIAFQVASRTDSRVVLDEMGAERLLGNGDMLFLSPGTSQILRGQGTFVSDDEINGVMGTIGTTEPQYAAELVNLQPAPSGDGAKSGTDGKDRDDLYAAAVEVIIREGRGSVSLLQRALGVGYGRGARLIDYMAEDGIVGQYAGSQAREVLITMEEWAARSGMQPLPADPAPRRLKIQPHAEKLAATTMVDDDEVIDRDEQAFDDESYDEEVDDEEPYDDEESE